MHIIRLRGPWQLEPLERYVRRDRGGYSGDTIGLPSGDSWKMPADWSETMGPDFLGVVRYLRKFRRPTGIDPTTKVWLVVEPPRSAGFVRLNRRPIGEVQFGQPAGRFDITDAMTDWNQLEIDVAHPLLDDDWMPPDDGSTHIPGGLTGEVRLEIEEQIQEH